MDIDLYIIKSMLGWGCIINAGLLLYWFSFLIFAHDWVYKLHGRWFNLTPQQFDKIHYAGLALFKLAIIAFYVVPYVTLSFLLD